MDIQNEAGAPAEIRRRTVGLTPGADCAKEVASPDISRIEYGSPENAVVLSDKLEQLIQRVGGCSVNEVRALVRRIMFEVISQRKY